MILVHYAAPRFVSVSSFDIFLRALLHARDISAPAAIHPRGEWTRGERERGRVVHAYFACRCIYSYFIIVVNRSGPCEIKQELLSTGYCIPRVACLNPVIVKFASDGWMSRARNSSSKVEFNLELNLCFSFVHSVLDCRICHCCIEISIFGFNRIHKDSMIFKFFLFLNRFIFWIEIIKWKGGIWWPSLRFINYSYVERRVCTLKTL